MVVSDVDLAGVGANQCRVGATFPARVLGAGADRAFATDTAGLHLRWAVGLFLVLLCGLADRLAHRGDQLRRLAVRRPPSR